MIGRDVDRSKIFNRRGAILAGGQAVLLSALFGRMYYLQVVEADRYRMLAEENRINFRLLPPPRGRILDRFGVALADNRQNFRVLLIPEQTSDIERTLDALAGVVDVSEYDRERVRREARRKRSFVPVTVLENLTWEDMARVQVNAPDLPGILIDEGLSRFYPNEHYAAHVLGYVSSVDEEEQTGDPLLELPGFRIGKSGVERTFDASLRGSGGTSQVEVNAVGRVIRELDRETGQPGEDLQLTIDERLQRFAADRLGAESAAAVVMDIYTGEILVMASTPAFDPNAFNRGLTNREWEGLSTDPRAPMTNKAIAGQYSPGSTYKMAVALAALEHGVVAPDETVFCPGHMDIGTRRFHCWKDEGHGAVNMVEALAQSCDVYFYDVARRLGVDRISAMARRLGLGENYDIGLNGQKSGLLPTEDWKRATLGEPWQPGETFNVGIGQGYVLSTPLQLAVMTARLANGGLAVEPKLLKSSEPAGLDPADLLPSTGISRLHLAEVRRGMYEVVNGPRGTARASKLRGMEDIMSGKTGTTQVRRITMAEREAGLKEQDELAWRERNHALFVAYAPENAPRYALSVIVEHGGGGAAVAAPIARDIMEQVLQFDPALKPRDDIQLATAEAP